MKLRALRHLPITQKIRLVILVACAATLLGAMGAVLVFDILTFQRTFRRDLAALAEIIANNSTAAVTFRDPRSAQEILRALRATPYVEAAHIRLPDGSLFARFGTPGLAGGWDAGPPGTRSWFAANHLILAEEIVLDSQPIGRLYVLADYGSVYRAVLWGHGQIFAGVLVLSILLVVLLSAQLQRVISNPILRLAGTAGEIAAQRDYTLRAAKVGADEVGSLTDAFNQMLDEVQHRDHALQQAQAQLASQVRTLEQEVAERRRAEAALRASEQRLELALLGSDAGLWDWDLRTGAVVRNARAAEMLGYVPDELAPTLEAWVALLHPDDLPPGRQAMRAHLKGETPQYMAEHRLRTKTGAWRWLLTRGRVVERDATGRPVRVAGTHVDVTERRAAEGALEEANRRLVQASRQAGMAEVATGVLHNVGNVLNSVNVSATLIGQKVRNSKAGGVAKLAELLAAHEAALGTFFTQDPRGRTVPAYLARLGAALAAEQRELEAEMGRLEKSLGHVKQVVAMQQSYAKLAGVRERVPLAAIVEDALTMQAEALARHGVELVREFAPVPPVTVDRHRLLQILMNLLNNAKYALEASGHPDKRLTVRIAHADGAGVAVAVTDNGVGIPPEHLTRIFAHGFTTRRDGHGFGLHSGALAAREMGGRLTAHSEGLGAGATFTLTLPLAAKETAA